jgi:hypothetical protein
MEKNIDPAEWMHDNNEDLLTLTLRKLLTNLVYEHFQESTIYLKIACLEKHQKDRKIKAFNYKEQKELGKEIDNYFAPFIMSLQKHGINLTKKELLICCLALRFSPFTISLCMGYYNTNSLKAHKTRIKKKMAESPYNFLFDFIFYK